MKKKCTFTEDARSVMTINTNAIFVRHKFFFYYHISKIFKVVNRANRGNSCCPVYLNVGSIMLTLLLLRVAAYCSHSRAHQLMTESIGSTVGFKARMCDSWEKYKKGHCNHNPIVLMGEYASTS